MTPLAALNCLLDCLRSAQLVCICLGVDLWQQPSLVVPGLQQVRVVAVHLEVVVAHLAALVHRVAVEARPAALVHQVAVVAVVYLQHRVALALAPLLLTLLAAPRSPARPRVPCMPCSILESSRSSPLTNRLST